ncbi:hypothetical protein T261_4563 [Streptomyces lydicus]|nr:hypothetical protein T261_4563 [Streptomyces lydicus]
MNEQQAIARAEEIIHQAVDSMSPKPTLKPARNTTGACLARDESGHDDRVQVTRMYRLAGVPGTDAKKLVRQARDAWVKHGYTFQSADADGDWSDPFPSVNMRTKPDDFWMEALTGVLDRQKGEGLATITVTSPCFAPSNSGKANSASSMLHTHNNEPAERQILAHSGRIHDALRVPNTPERGSRPRQVQDSDGTWIHHAWSTAPLTGEETVRAMGRVQTHFTDMGWATHTLATETSFPALVAFNASDRSVAQVAPSSSGHIRVAVTSPAVPVSYTDV